MKMKVSPWGNSQGIRITGPLLDHLNVTPGAELVINLTEKGLEIMKNTPSQDYVKEVAQEVIDGIVATSEPVKTVDDPEAELEVGYLVIAINPCQPRLREVPKDTPGAYRTLAKAKEAARQVLQNAMAEAKASLTELRQVGIEKITYIAL